MESRDYHFVIVGGGTAGLTIATRLSEDPNVSVLVLEAGSDYTEDPIINVLAQHFATFCDPKYDWDYHTVPQPHAHDRVFNWNRGKGLGGSSAVNFGMYSQSSRTDLNNWEALGNIGWNWETLAPYYRKHETFHLPSKENAKKYQCDYLDPATRGEDGPIQVSLSEHDVTWLQEAWPPTAQNAGYPVPRDPRSGSAIGGFNNLSCIDPKTMTRSYAANAYWAPNKHRPNLKVMSRALTTKINFTRIDNVPRAASVTVEIDGSPMRINATQEVILCAGAIASPHLLEVSGIGSRKLLESIGVDVVVDNENVGENLQDHIFTGPTYVVKDGLPTAETLFRSMDAREAAMQAYNKDKTGPLANSSTCTSFVSLSALTNDKTEPIFNAIDSSLEHTSPSLIQHHSLIRQQLSSPIEAAAQVIVNPCGMDIDKSANTRDLFGHSLPVNGCVAFCTNICHPLSRGSIHAKTSDIHDEPVIDPQYFSHPADRELIGHCVLHAQKLSEVEPLASMLKGGENGHKLMAPKFKHCESLEEAKDLGRHYTCSTWHPCGTCAMLPRDMGGVVDTSCRVYGTKGLRVVDASVFPLIPQGNIMSLVYAVAEKMADVVKEEHAGLFSA